MNKTMFILISIVSLAACHKKPAVQEEVRPVLTEIVKYYGGPPPLIFSGFSKSEKFINVSFRVGGLIAELPIKVGDRLNRGDLIAKLDETDFFLHVQEAQATFEEAHALLRKSSAQYKRIKILYESESASRNELDVARAAFESAKAGVEQAESKLDLSRKELSYTILQVEQDVCEVAEKEAEINENVEPGETIATLTCGNILEVEIAVPESDITGIQQGEDVDVYFNTLPKEIFKGVVREVGVAASNATTFPVTIGLLKQDQRLRSGMAVKAVIPQTQLLNKKNMIVVPLEAVSEDQKGNYVYIFEEEKGGVGIAHKVYVKTGELMPKGIVITSGLESDQEIIIAGLRYLTEGKKVKRLEDKRLFKKKRK